MSRLHGEQKMNPDYESKTKCADGDFCACHHLDGGMCDLCSEIGCKEDEF